MYQYENYEIPQIQFEDNPYVQQNHDSSDRQLSLQLPQWQQFERRINLLERQNNQQEREIEQLRRRLQRVNQRLSIIENRLFIPIMPFYEGF
ncbi:hypothetical protein [Heyndrickxia ginsengihumi]|uniref:Uncharacterized protein n=1 Tax=Heyndrickxia ginsengihumi TaxID=363870 RepID=A0A0A6XWA3_9BACI|nr:hypothetical protein [Heyndrickxia ginsengihumi]KHD84412.1 hypothetical protein NG54_15570 [Heyndrickxia ginsengihumi]